MRTLLKRFKIPTFLSIATTHSVYTTHATHNDNLYFHEHISNELQFSKSNT